MKIDFKKFTTKTAIVSKILTVLGLILIGYGGYRYYFLAEEFETAKEYFASATIEFENKIRELETSLASSTEENIKLTKDFRAEQGKNDYFDFQLKSIAGTVGTLQKLSMTDPELLKKYSKVYFLNENYIPPTLTDISSSEFVYKNGKSVQIHTEVWSHLQKLLIKASQENIPLQIISGYRSFGEQSSLKASYRVAYGAGTANQFSADQGYSEHQLGTAVDLTTPDIGAFFEKFKTTSAYAWLNQNAYQYGFILSYPANNSYYQFEPWHWRFVGVALATKLYNENKNFYDLGEREIDTYLINLFD
ncbi:MAG: M15 family metallopeptidase [Patescibacteria group bacterium]